MKAFVVCLCAAFLASGALAVGGVNNADPHDQGVVDAATFAVREINRRENSLYSLLLSSVVDVSTQVVAGMKYDMTVEAERSTDCRNDGLSHTMCSCTADKNQKHAFKVEVLSQPWMNPPMELLSMKEVPVASPNSVESTVSKSLTVGSAIKSAPSNFQDFLKQYTPDYCNNAAEISKRAAIFQNNLVRAKTYQQNDKGTAKYGVTKFADLSEDEFRQRYLQSKPMQPDPTLEEADPVKTNDAPDSFDWRQHGVVSPVKNQGSCGSCWAFSTTGNVEGQWAIKKKALVSLSEQELVDCDKVDQGCQGGLPSQAYKQIMSLGGLTTEAKYPYTAKNGECHFNPSTQGPLVYINGSLALPKDEEQLAAWLAQNGPISIGINAGPMQFYMGGISHPWKLFCNPEHLDHGVLIVGYGRKDSEPYWIIKNSWGSSWGEGGYYLVYRGAGVCGLNRMATSSIIH